MKSLTEGIFLSLVVLQGCLVVAKGIRSEKLPEWFCTGEKDVVQAPS